MSAIIYEGDCLAVMAGMADCSVDSVVADPPAGIGFMGKAWDGDKGGRNQWVAWLSEVMGECLRVLKPGGHALVWALPRTSHWTATAVEDAGFEIRDVVMHIFGSGFPKSMSVSKAIEATERLGKSNTRSLRQVEQEGQGEAYLLKGRNNGILGEQKTWERKEYLPSTEAAKQWQGWGTALKPAAEHWILARKPLIGTVAANVQEYGTGAINIDGCRIDTAGETWGGNAANAHEDYSGKIYGKFGKQYAKPSNPIGRWPANVTLDEEAAAALDAQTAETRASKPSATGTAFKPTGLFPIDNQEPASYEDSGGASRFFYCAKASASERGEGNSHPTVKPLKLLSYLCRLVTPPHGTVLDPFMGSGTTGCAAITEGFAFIGIERERDYCTIARRRLAAAEASRQPALFAAD
jgi:site-specific DNA-methyltransferase (adenine-specific)